MTGRGQAMATTKADVKEWVETQLATLKNAAHGQGLGRDRGGVPRTWEA